MKKLTWQQWTAIGILVAVVVAGVILHLVQPQVSFAFTELGCALAFLLGGVAGYLLKKNNIVNKEK